jgi:hypothetical protein
MNFYKAIAKVEKMTGQKADVDVGNVTVYYKGYRIQFFCNGQLTPEANATCYSTCRQDLHMDTSTDYFPQTFWDNITQCVKHIDRMVPDAEPDPVEPSITQSQNATQTWTRIQLATGDGGTMSPDRYSKYHERLKMADRGEIGRDEVYGVEQAKEHAAELWATEGEYAEYWSKRKFVIQREVTTVEALEEVTPPPREISDCSTCGTPTSSPNQDGLCFRCSVREQSLLAEVAA